MRTNGNTPISPSPNTHGFDNARLQNAQTPDQPDGHSTECKPTDHCLVEHNSIQDPIQHSPLGHKECKLIAITLLQSAGILAFATVLLAYLIVALKTGDPIACLVNGSWFIFLLDQCTLPAQWWCAPLIMIGIYVAVNLIAQLFYPGYQRDELDLRQGINGELIFSPLLYILTLIPLTNIFEETTFRACVIPLLMLVCSALGIDAMASAIIAIAGSTLIFLLVHWQYRNKLSVVMTLIGGGSLGVIYVISQSVLVCIIAHVAYNWFVLYFERMIARDNPNYFGGKQPTHYVSDLLLKER